MSSTGTGTDPTSASTADMRADPLFIDTGAFFAYYNDRDGHHETARAFFQAVRTGDLAYSPLYTTRFVLAELTPIGSAEAPPSRSEAEGPASRVGRSAFV